MVTLEGAIEQALKCTGFKKGERVVVIYDRAASEIATPLIYYARAMSGDVTSYLMEDYGERPDNGVNPLKFPEEIGRSLREADVSFYIAGETKKGERESFRHPMNEIVDSNVRLRHAHMPGITKETFLSGMSADYSRLKEITKRVNDIVMNAGQIKVTTPAGSDFYAQFSSEYRWIISDGFIKPEIWSNLPGSETYTCPTNLEGRIVVDGVLGDYFDQKYGLLDKNPLIVGAKGGRVISVESSNKRLEKEFNEYILRDENANRFGEFAIGTNIGIKRIFGNMLHDEKFPGVHVAIGYPYPKETGADWESGIHCDMVMRDCNIYVDGKRIMERGQFITEITA